MRKRMFAAAVCAAVAVMTAGSAFAGEITGTGRSLQIAPHQLHGNSACAFSGLNDDFVLGATGVPRVQSFGEGVAESVHAGEGPLGGIPGTACNGSG